MVPQDTNATNFTWVGLCSLDNLSEGPVVVESAEACDILFFDFAITEMVKNEGIGICGICDNNASNVRGCVS